MQRDNRSRDPEGSRRRWYESRDRDPRDQDRDQGDSRQQTPRALPPHQPPPPQQYPQQPFSPMYQQTPPPRQYDPRYDQSPMYQQSPQYPRFPAPPQQYHQQRPHPYTNAPPQSMPAYNDPRQSQQTPQRPQTPSSVFSSSSDTSTSLLDISRFKDTKQFGGVFGTFFKAPSDRVKQRLHRKKQKKRRVLYFGNSSSSSVNSDLAYGYGYVKQPKSRTLSPRSQSRASGQTHGSVSGQGPSNGHRRRSSGGSDRASRPVPRKKTADEEIMALGQQLSDLARRSKEDEQRISSRGSGKGKAAALGLAAGAAGAAMGSRFGKQKQSPKGKGKSKHRVDTSDDGSEWEDASDDEGTSSSDDAASAGDSELAYGTVGESIKPAVGVAAAAGSAAAAAAMADSRRHSGYSQSSEYRRFEDRGSIVDPRLFGPYNSLRGSINTPCGFRDEGQAEAYRRDSGNFVFGSPIQMRDSYPGPPGPPGPAPGHSRFSSAQFSASGPQHDSLPRPAPGPVSGPVSGHNRFGSAQFSASGPQQDSSPRPAAVPLQQPVPKLPVSSKVYETEKYEDVNGKESRQRRQEQSNGKSWSGVAAAGLAAAAASAALASSSRKDSREHHDEKKFDRDNRDRREQERIDMERQKALEVEQQKLNELERQKARELERYKNQNPGRQYDDWEQWHKSLEHERERNAKWERDYRETEPEAVIPNYNNDRKSSRYNDHDDTPTERKEKKEKKEKQKYDIVVEPQRDQGKGGAFRIEHGQEFKVMNEPVVQAESSQRNDTRDGRDLPLPTGAGHQAITKPTESDPDFVDPFQYQVADDAFTLSQRTTPGRPLTPNVVTVEREPNFDDSPPRTSAADARLSRRDSFEIERMVEDYRRDSQDVPQQRKPQTGREYEKEEREAKSILDEAKMATIPVAAVAVASAVAVEHERSKGQRKGKSSKGKSQQNSRGRKDAVQEEADRYYRESCIARKIASEEMRSRSASPEPSVVDKWQDDKNESFTIVTPPAMEDKHTEKSIYEGPDADVKIDNKIYPQEERRFRNLGDNSSALVLRQRDISRERPVLNLIYPTPAASRQPTPAPAARKQEKEESFDAEDVIIGPKGEILPASEPVSVAKSVSWGENETKRFDAHTPEARSETENYFPKDKSPDKPRPKLNKASRWGILAAALAGSSAEPHNEPDVEVPSKQSDIPRNFPDDTSRDVLVQRAEAFGDDASREPPVPGPKPASPHRGQMPGGYADDLEFAATLAAGLKDTGFNPDIVIEDPSYSRRDSPPGVQEANGDSHGNTNGNSWYKRPYVDPVPEMNDPNVPKLLPEQGFVLGEVETPQEKTFTPYRSERDIKSGPPKPEDVPLPDNGPDNTKLSKREQRKRDKSDVVVVQDDGKIENVRAEPSPAREVVEEVWEDTTRKKGKKKDRKSRDLEDDSSSRAPAPFDYNTTPSRDSPARDSRSYSDWSAPRDEDRSRDFSAADIAKVAVPALALGALASSSSRDTPSRDVHSDDERDARKKSRKQLNEGDYYDDDRSRISSSAKPSHHGHSSQDVSSRDVRDDEFDESKHSRKHKKDRESRDDKYRDYTNLDPVDRRSSRRDGSRDRSRDRSRHHSRERSRHRSRDRSRDHRSRDHRSRDRTRDKSRDRSRHRRSDDEEERPKSSKRHPYGYDSPSRSLAASEISLGSTSSRRSKKSKRRSGNEDDFDDSRDSPSDRKRDLFDDRDVSSVVSESRGHRRKSSRYDDDDAKSVASSPGSSRRDKEHKERRTPEKRASNSVLSSLFKTRKDKKDSFLGNADTLGAGVGLASAATIIASDATRSNAADASSNQYHSVSRDGHRRARSYELVDPEVVSRVIKPAIDPQYGDLLPLPPSEPSSPISGPEDLPPLPDSRPDTPPQDRTMRRDMWSHQRRRSAFDTPIKSPSRTAVPIALRLGNRSNPGSPVSFKTSPGGSPIASHSDAVVMSRRAARPTSWDSTREIMPLYLLEHSRHQPTTGSVLPALPPSEPSETSAKNSPESEFLKHNDNYFGDELDFIGPDLRVDTQLSQQHEKDSDAGSEETTPRAEFMPVLPVPEHSQAADEPTEELDTSLPLPVESTSKDMGRDLYSPTPSPVDVAAMAVPAALAATAVIRGKERADSPTERADDLESADEHFSDAFEGHSEPSSPGAYVFRALASSFDDRPSPRVQYGYEPITYPMAIPPQEPVVEEPVAREPASKELVAEEPIAEKSFVQEPPINSVTELLGLPAKEPAVEEPTTEEPSVEQTIVNEPTNDPVTDRALVKEQPVDSVTELLGLPSEKAKTEEPTVQEPTYYPATEPAIEPIVTPAEEPVVEEPTAERSFVEEPPIDSVTELLGLPASKATTEEPIVQEPTYYPATGPVTDPVDHHAQQTIVKEPIVEEPAAERSFVGESPIDSVTELLGLPASTVITEQPIVQEPTYYPATEPVAEPANEAATESIVTPAGEPAIEKPTAAKSLIEESPVDSVTELLGLPTDEPTVQEPVIEQPTIEEPIVEEPTNKESPVEEPSVESVTKLLGLPMEAPTAKESVAKEPTVEESTHEEPSARSVTELLGIPAQEPAVEKPEIEEPTTEGPTVEQRIDALEPTVQYGPQPFNESVVDRKVEDTYPVHQAPGTGSFEQPAEESSRDLTGGSTAEDVVMPAIDSSFHPTQESATESIVNATPEIVEPVGELENGASREPASALREINKEPNSAPVSEPMVEDVPAMEPAIKTLPESTAENTRGDARQADTTLITPAPETVVEPPPASATEATPEPTSEVIEAAEAKPEGPVSQRGEHEITTEEWESMTAKDRKNMKKKLRKKGQEPIIKDSFDAPVLPQESSKAIETAQNEDNSAKDQSPETTPVATGIESLVEPVPDHSLESLAEDSHAPKTIDAQEPVVSQEQQSTTMEPKEPSELVEEVLPAHQGPSTEQDAEDVQKDPEITSTPAIAEPEHDRTLPPSAEPQLDTENTSTTPLTMAEEIIEDPKESPSKSKKKKKIKAQQQAEEEVAKAGPTVTETEDPAPAPTPEADRDAFAAWTEPDVIVETPVETPVEPAEAVAESGLDSATKSLPDVIAEPVVDADAFDAWAEPDAIAETVDVPEEMQDKPTAAAESAPEVPVEPTRDDVTSPSKSKKKKKKKKGNKADDESAIDNTETPRPEESAPVEKYQANEISPDLTRGTVEERPSTAPETKTESAKTTQLDKTQTPPPIMPPMNASTWRFGRGKSLPPVVAPEPDDGGIDDSPPSSPRPSSSNEGRNGSPSQRYFPSALRALPSTAGISAFKRMWGFQDQSKAENKSRQAKPDTTLPDAPTQADPVTVEKSDVADVKSDAPDTSPSRDLVTNDKLDAESAEKSETADIKPDTPVADLNREIAVDDVARPKFDSFISEPLFSQDSAPLEESQLEASQIDEPQNNSDKLSRDIPQDQIATEGQSGETNQEHATKALEPVLEQAVGENPRKITEDDASKSAETQDFQPTSKETEKPIDVKPAQDTQENLVVAAPDLDTTPAELKLEDGAKSLEVEPVQAVREEPGTITKDDAVNPTEGAVPENAEVDEAGSKKKAKKNKKKKKSQASQAESTEDQPNEMTKQDDVPQQPQADEAKLVSDVPTAEESVLSTKEQASRDHGEEFKPEDKLQADNSIIETEAKEPPAIDDKPVDESVIREQPKTDATKELSQIDDKPSEPEIKHQPQIDETKDQPKTDEKPVDEPEPKEHLQTDDKPADELDMKQHPEIDEVNDQPKVDDKPVNEPELEDQQKPDDKPVELEIKDQPYSDDKPAETEIKDQTLAGETRERARTDDIPANGPELKEQPQTDDKRSEPETMNQSQNDEKPAEPQHEEQLQVDPAQDQSKIDDKSMLEPEPKEQLQTDNEPVKEPMSEESVQISDDLAAKSSANDAVPVEVLDAERIAKEAREAEEKATREAEEAEAASENAEMESLLEKKSKRKGRLLKKDQARLTALEENATRRAEERATREAENQVAEQEVKPTIADVPIQSSSEADNASEKPEEAQNKDVPQASGEITTERTSDTSAIPLVPNEGEAQDAGQSTEDPVSSTPLPIAGQTEENHNTVDTAQPTEQQDAVVADEGVEPASSKKSKKKKKRKSVSFVENGEAQDTATDNVEPPVLAPEPQLLGQSTASTEAPITEEASNTPVDEHTVNDVPPTDAKQTEGHPLAMSEEPVAESAPVEPQPEDTADPVLNDAASEAPSEAPSEESSEKKSKKKKKKKKNASSSDEPETQPGAESQPQETPESALKKDAPEDVRDATPQDTSPNASNATESGGVKSTEVPLSKDEAALPLQPETNTSHEPVLADEEQTQPADVNIPVETPPTQEPAPTVEADKADKANIRAPDQPVADDSLNIEDPDSPAKLSKKDKKKKKKAEKKKAALEGTPDPESDLATPSQNAEALPKDETADLPTETSKDTRDETPKQTDTNGTPDKDSNLEGKLAAPADDAKTPDTGDSGKLPSEEPAGPEDERGGFSLSQSQTDQKNKAKDNDFEILQDPETKHPTEPNPKPEKEDADVTAVDEAKSQGPSEGNEPEEDKTIAGDLEVPVKPEAKLEPGSELGEEKLEDNEEFAGLSKKQIKKLKKVKALAALEPPLEPSPPKEPEPSNEETLEPAAEAGSEAGSKLQTQSESAGAESPNKAVEELGPEVENETSSEIKETVPIDEPNFEAESKSKTETQSLGGPDTQPATEPAAAEPEADADVPTSQPESQQQMTPDQDIIVPAPEVKSGDETHAPHEDSITNIATDQEVVEEDRADLPRQPPQETLEVIQTPVMAPGANPEHSVTDNTNVTEPVLEDRSPHALDEKENIAEPSEDREALEQDAVLSLAAPVSPLEVPADALAKTLDNDISQETADGPDEPFAQLPKHTAQPKTELEPDHSLQPFSDSHVHETSVSLPDSADIIERKPKDPESSGSPHRSSSATIEQPTKPLESNDDSADLTGIVEPQQQAEAYPVLQPPGASEVSPVPEPEVTVPSESVEALTPPVKNVDEAIAGLSDVEQNKLNEDQKKEPSENAEQPEESTQPVGGETSLDTTIVDDVMVPADRSMPEHKQEAVPEASPSAPVVTDTDQGSAPEVIDDKREEETAQSFNDKTSEHVSELLQEEPLSESTHFVAMPDIDVRVAKASDGQVAELLDQVDEKKSVEDPTATKVEVPDTSKLINDAALPRLDDSEPSHVRDLASPVQPVSPPAVTDTVETKVSTTSAHERAENEFTTEEWQDLSAKDRKNIKKKLKKKNLDLVIKDSFEPTASANDDLPQIAPELVSATPQTKPTVIQETPENDDLITEEKKRLESQDEPEVTIDQSTSVTDNQEREPEDSPPMPESLSNIGRESERQEIPQNNADLPTNDETKREQNSIKDAEGEPSALADVPTTTDARPASEDDQPTSQSQNEIDSSLPANGSTPPEPEIDTVATELITESNAELLPEHKPVPETTSQQLTDESSPAKGSKDLLLEPVPEISYVPVTDARSAIDATPVRTSEEAEPLTERPPEPPVEVSPKKSKKKKKSRKSSLVVTEPELIGETTGSAKQETQMPSMEHTPEHQMKNESEDKVITVMPPAPTAELQPSTEPLPTDMAEQPAPGSPLQKPLQQETDVQLTGIENTNSPVRAADDNNETKVEQESAPGVEKARDVTLVEMPPSLEDVESAEPAQPQQEPIAEAERPSLGMADAAWQTNDESTITGQAEAEKEIPLDVEPNCKDTKTVVEDEKEEKVELNDNNEEHAELEPVPIPAELPEEQRSRGNTVLEAIDQQTVAEPAASEQFGLDASFSPERQPADPLPTPISHQDDKQEPAGQKPEKQEDPVKSIDVIEVPAEPSQPDTAAQVKDTASLPLSPKDKKKKKRKSKAADSLPAEPTEPAEPTGQPYTEPPRTYDNKVTTSPNDATAENPTQLATPSTADVLEPSRESDQTRNSVPEAKQEDVQDNKGPFLDNSVADREDNTLEGIPLSRDVTLAEGATTDMPPSDPLAAYETLPSVGNESPSVVEAEVKTTDNPSPPQSSEHSLQVEEASIAPVKSSKKDKKNKKKKQKQIDDDADTSRDSQDGASSALLQVDQPVKGDSPAKQPIQLTEPVPETSDLDKSAPTAGEPGTSVHAVFEPVEEVNPPVFAEEPKALGKEPDVIDREVLDQIKDTPLSESGTLGEPLAAEQTRELVQETQASQSPPEQVDSGFETRQHDIQTPEPQSAKETETTDMTNTVSLVPLADKEDHQSGGTQEIISQDAQPEQPTGTARDFAPPADSATMDIDVPASYKDVSPVTEVPRKASIGEPTTTNAPRHLASADDHATEVPTPSQAVSPAVGVLDSITGQHTADPKTTSQEIPTPGSQPSSSGQTTTMPADDILAAKIAKRERKLARKLAKERAAAEREAAEKPTVSDGQDPVLPSSNKSAQSEEPGKPVSQKEDITQKAPTTVATEAPTEATKDDHVRELATKEPKKSKKSKQKPETSIPEPANEPDVQPVAMSRQSEATSSKSTDSDLIRSQPTPVPMETSIKSEGQSQNYTGTEPDATATDKLSDDTSVSKATSDPPALKGKERRLPEGVANTPSSKEETKAAPSSSKPSKSIFAGFTAATAAWGSALFGDKKDVPETNDKKQDEGQKPEGKSHPREGREGHNGKTQTGEQNATTMSSHGIKPTVKDTGKDSPKENSTPRETKEAKPKGLNDGLPTDNNDHKDKGKGAASDLKEEVKLTEKKKTSKKVKAVAPPADDTIFDVPQMSKDTEKKDKKSEAATAVRETPAKVEKLRKETSRVSQHETLDEVESPILGRGDLELSRGSPRPLLRRDSAVEEPKGGLLREDSKTFTPLMGTESDISDLRRSPSRLLEPVPEVPEAEVEPTRAATSAPKRTRDSDTVGDASSFQRRSRRMSEEAKRDSGLGRETPTSRRSKRSSPERSRDSGVHTEDWVEPERRPQSAIDRSALYSPEPPSERRLRRSPRGTPVLREPTAPETAPEPEKKKQYGALTPAGAAATAVAVGAGAGLAAALRAGGPEPSPSPLTSPTPITPTPRPRSNPNSNPASTSISGRRSASDNASPTRRPTPRLDAAGRRTVSNTSLSRRRTPEPLNFRPESPGINRASGTPTPPLRRVDKRMSSDLRAIRQQNTTAAPANSTPVANEGRARAKDMADVYDGFGEGRIGSPRSPTRPHSMRRRQSMQVLELENRVELLMAENRMLAEARAMTESSLSQRAANSLSERDSEIDKLRQSLQFLQHEVSRLTEVNEGLTSANAELANKDSGRVADLESRHAEVARELEETRRAKGSSEQTLEAKDAEIAELRAELDSAKEKIRDLQRQILESKANDDHFLNIRDEDHFDHRCQQLCSHVQQWVLRFSKFSDMRACRLTGEINDEKTIDRLDNAVLDGSDVDVYLRDRVKRRDIFMSMTMNMVWEFVFTRYLFGMDREQRQKLKSLEKLLTEVGPPEAVRQWRAVTLTLLAKRESFKRQRDLDTEAVVQAIFQTLCKILPPPSNLEDQIQSQLRRVMREAVGLSIEMRTQKAEYMMLPPLRPEYDADGELTATVQFNASMMNERSGSITTSNEDLEAQGAIVRIVLFPLVVKKGDDNGKGDEEIVVCPAQVLVPRSKHLFGGASDGGSTSIGARSHISVVTETLGQTEVDYLDGGS